jgi:hypothetical protein
MDGGQGSVRSAQSGPVKTGAHNFLTFGCYFAGEWMAANPQVGIPLGPAAWGNWIYFMTNYSLSSVSGEPQHLNYQGQSGLPRSCPVLISQDFRRK